MRMDDALETYLDSFLPSVEEQARISRNMRYAAQLADAIKAQGFTKEYFAFKMGVLPSEVDRWLSGTYTLSALNIKDINKVLKVDFTDIEI